MKKNDETSRRQTLQLLGAAGMTALAGCNGGSSGHPGGGGSGGAGGSGGTGGAAGINLASVRSSAIRNNLLYANHATGIAGWDDGDGNQWGTRGNLIANNTIASGNHRKRASFATIPISARASVGTLAFVTQPAGGDHESTNRNEANDATERKRRFDPLTVTPRCTTNACRSG